ncbi:MAG: hypothetical protein HYW77_01970 [Parcubacteria group bacterium]|nr:hypothetical protein [Parcubacteria group bacterium]
MRIKHLKVLSILILFFYNLCNFHGKSPPVFQEKVIGRLLSEKIEEAVKKWTQYEHEEIKINDQLKGDFDLKKREILRYLVKHENGKEFHYLLERDGRLNPKPQWILAKPRFAVDDKMFSDTRYDFNVEKEFYENGERFLVLSFKPIKNPPVSEGRDVVLNNMTGIVILRQKDLLPIKIAAKLSREVEISGTGYQVKFFTMTIEVEFQEIDKILMLKRVSAQYHFRFKVLFLFNVREENKKEEYIYSNFRRRQ